MLILNIYSLKDLKTLEDIYNNEGPKDQNEWNMTKIGDENCILGMKTKLSEAIAKNSQLECKNLSLQHEIDVVEKSLESVQFKISYATKIQRERLYRKIHSSKTICGIADELTFKAPRKTSSFLVQKKDMVTKVKLRRSVFTSV